MTTAPTADDLAVWLDDAIATDEAVIDCVESARAQIEVRCTIPDDPDDYPQAVRTAVLIQASRLNKRRLTPEGVAAFGEFGVVRFNTLDADVENLITPHLTLTGFSGGSDS